MTKEQYYSPDIETASRETMKAIQSENLKEMLKRCCEKVPFYKKKFDEAGIKPEDIQSIDDLHKLPFTYKTDLRDNYPFGLFAAPKEDVIRIHASSGTTGKQTVVGYTARDMDDWSVGVARALIAAGADKESYIHVSYGYGLFTGGLGLHDGATKLGCAVIPVSSGNTNRQIQIMQDFGSNVLCCTPSYALFIGETLKEAGIDPKTLSLKAGIFGAEPWTDAMREKIEELLDIKAYDIYGLSEISGPGVSFGCSEQNGMHVNEDMFYPEIIDPDTGEVLSDGQQGELVFTCIRKEALPLVRYRTRDICTLTREKCSCGRTLIRMGKPQGRTDDMLIIRGVNVFPSQVEHVLLALKLTTAHYLLVVDRINSQDVLEVQVEMLPEMFSDTIKEIEAVEAKIKNALASTLGLAARVKLVEPKSIERSMGKAVRVVDKRKL